jgi:hypothetical protein
MSQISVGLFIFADWFPGGKAFAGMGIAERSCPRDAKGRAFLGWIYQMPTCQSWSRQSTPAAMRAGIGMRWHGYD